VEREEGVKLKVKDLTLSDLKLLGIRQKFRSISNSQEGKESRYII
jgi:hypothetical protein